ncbi:MAG: ribonuclease III [Pseudomonadota bacterium]
MANTLSDLQTRLGHTFSDSALLELALTHRSAGSANNERLEFLGDSLLNCVVASELYQLKPDLSEGELSRLRSTLVRGSTLAELAKEIALADHLKMGQGELRSGGFARESIQADAVEALLGAVYLDAGFAACRDVITRLLAQRFANLPSVGALKDPKTQLQEWLQGRGLALPSYHLVRSSGKDHERVFWVACEVEHPALRVEAQGASRRKAEQSAAADVLTALRAMPGVPS